MEISMAESLISSMVHIGLGGTSLFLLIWGMVMFSLLIFIMLIFFGLFEEKNESSP